MRHHQKRFLTIFFVILSLFLFLLIYFLINFQYPRQVISRLFSQTVFAEELPEEYIEDFQAVIKINSDNTVDVQEKIIYNFGDQERHGIYRDIPYKYHVRGGNFTIGLKVNSVTDENNQLYAYEEIKGGGQVKIKIGDPNILVTGVKTYLINYQMNRVINFFDDHDEFYWNVIGNNWTVPVDRAGVVIKLPEGTQASDLRTQCFTGQFLSQEQNCQVTNVSNSQVGYSVFRILAPNEGFTVVLGWPKGILAPPSVVTQIKWIIKDNPLMVLPFIAFLAMFLLWYFHGRDLGKKQAIIPVYETPEELLPAEVGTIIDERVNPRDISSSLIDLARRGYLKIRAIADTTDWELTKLKDFIGLKIWETEFINAVFADKSTVKISDLKNKFYRHLPELTKMLYQSLVEKSYFPVSPNRVRNLYLLIAVILIFLGIIAAPFFGGGLNIVFLCISGFVVLWLGQYMPRKTKLGTKVYQQIKGYKMYLTVAEKDRLKFHGAPEKKPELFEKHLAFAMVLGVEKKWANQFKDIYLNQPEWYQDQFVAFNSLVLADSLSHLNSAARSAIMSGNSNASSGSSGFSGGFSGGGFGGGGGGSW